MLTVCCAGFMTITASAAVTIEGSEVTWSFDYQSKTLTFAGKGDIPDYDTYEDSTGKSTIPWSGCAYSTIEFGNEITGIGNYAFRKSTELVAVIVPETIKKIGVGAFSNSLALKSVTIKSGVTEISNNAFMGCIALSTVELSNGLTKIGNNAFYKCTALKNIIIPDSVATIDSGAFNSCTALESFTAPKSLETIGDRAFYCCEQLKTVTLGESMSYIGISAFDSCAKLKEITIPMGIKKISESAFSGCSGLEKVLIPEGIQTIEDEAFYLCTALTAIRIPYSVKTIGAKALGIGRRNALVSGFTVTGYDNTAAQTYATENGIGFNSLGDALAKSGKIGEQITWTLDENATVTFTGSGAMADFSVYDMPVYFNSGAKKFIVGNEITTFGAYAFPGNYNSFIISEKVISIGEKAIGYHLDENGKLVKNENFKIVGAKGSAAETYAEANGFVFVALANEGSCGEKATWSYDAASKTLTVSGEGKIDMNYDNATIPSFILNGYPVEKVIVNEGITEIAENAFLDIDNGESEITFRIAKSVATIGDHAIGFSKKTVANDDKTETASYVLNEKCVIEGYAATEAETYAAKNGIDFVTLDPSATIDTTFEIKDTATICTLDKESKTIKVFAQDAKEESILADFTIGRDLVIGKIEKVATGATFTATYGTTVSDTYTLALMGDVNNDGAVNSADALCVLRHSVALATLEGTDFVAADLDASGVVNSTDALTILRVSVGLESLGNLYPKTETTPEATDSTEAK